MSNRFLAGVLALLVVGLIWYANAPRDPEQKGDANPSQQQAEVKKDDANPVAEPAPQITAEAPKVAEPAPEVPKAAEAVPETSKVTESAPQSKVAAPAPAPQEKAITPPSFDTVRVEPTGDVVVAGRGEPDSIVTLLIDGRASDSAELKSTGQFVVIPLPLKPGPHILSLSMKLPDGRIFPSVQDVTVDVPDQPKGNVVVALSEPGKATEILVPIPPDLTAAGDLAVNMAPATVSPLPAEIAPRAGVAITVVEAEDSGTLYASGTAARDASVRLYLNDAYLDTARVGAEGKWSLKVVKGITPGSYHIRVDDVEEATGKVLSRAEVTFDFAPKATAVSAVAGTKDATEMQGTTQTQSAAETQSSSTSESPVVALKDSSEVVVASIETATVVRGDSLWRISKKIYGSGFRYTVIHRANRDQIRNPDLIYPGQVFVLPTAQ
ncbi:MAG: LysM peptidoglycan-binding domain-containing protein [Hyphomicrobiales bacterium]